MPLPYQYLRCHCHCHCFVFFLNLTIQYTESRSTSSKHNGQEDDEHNVRMREHVYMTNFGGMKELMKVVHVTERQRIMILEEENEQTNIRTDSNTNGD